MHSLKRKVQLPIDIYSVFGEYLQYELNCRRDDVMEYGKRSSVAPPTLRF